MALPWLLALALSGEPLEETRSFESAHYRLVAPPSFAGAQEYLHLAEALYAQLEAHFGAHPALEARLEVRFWPDVESYTRDGRADGIPAETLASGGVYWTGTRRAYFWRQPSESFTRHLFLHELTHQFQFLAVMHNEARAPAWYGEGLAEHAGYHLWDGTSLAIGAEDVLGLEEDIPRLSELGRAGRFDLVAQVEGRAGADKPPSWAAVHYLLAGPDRELTRRFRALEPRLWSGELDGPALCEALFGSERAAANAAANRWLAGLRTTWKIEWIHWDARGAELVGESAVVALVRSRELHAAGAFVEATLRCESGSAGLVLGWRSNDEFLALYRRASARLELVQRANGAWTMLASADGPPGASIHLRAELEASGRVRVTSAGRELLVHELGRAIGPAAVGLFADGGRTRFTEVALPPDPAR